jgi:lysophospholipase L1-like esterase
MTSMDPRLLKRAVVTLVVCGALVAVGRSEPRASWSDPGISPVRRLVRMLHDRNVGRDANAEQVAGYYEGLLAGRPVTLLGRSDDSAAYRFRGDFLYYEAKPKLDLADYDDPALRHVTNSHGMPDLEYSIERRPGTRRLAVLGDSVTRGQGAPFGESFEALLERHLNERYTGNGVEAYELLNFSNTGYRLTQLLDVALEKAPAFAPDVYVVCLTQLSVSRKWGDHIAQLMYDRIDLKYPYLRQLAVDARLDGRDPPGTMDAKLASYRLPAIRWAMAEIQRKARSEGATVLAVLVPTASSPGRQQELFADVREVLGDLAIPTIDLLDTFEGVEDTLPFMVEEGNVHPNREGHRRIFERFGQKIATDPVAAAVLLPAQPEAGSSSTRP